MSNLTFVQEPSLRYISLFSGIGGFEQAIHKEYPDADCIGFSEIDPYAVKIYKSHFPGHTNMGDVTKITKKKIRHLVSRFGCDLIVGGFPCTNLSSLANIQGNSEGLKGPKSGLFYDMIKIIEYAKSVNSKVKFIIENNFSMKKVYREAITTTLKEKFGDVYSRVINNADFGVQSRKRIIWTNFPFKGATNTCTQTWNDVLEPFDKVQDYKLSDRMVQCLNRTGDYKNSRGFTKIAMPTSKGRYRFENIETNLQKSRWDIQSRSDNMSHQMYDCYPVGKSRPITTGYGGGKNALIDRRKGKSDRKYSSFIFRSFTPTELERLFGLPDGYTDVDNMSNTRRTFALGNSVPVFIAHHVVKQLSV